jgi:hypothetical protein
MSTVPPAAVSSPRPMTNAQLDQLSINCIRTLSMDAVQQGDNGFDRSARRLSMPNPANSIPSATL